MTIYTSKALREQFPNVHETLASHLNLREIDSPNLWVRDYMPVKIGDDFVKFKYKGYDGFPQLPVDDALWHEVDAILSDIFLDGGNVVQDENTVFITEIVFTHNPSILVNDLKQFLKDIFFPKKLIFIPVEFGDDLGHADGIIKFIDAKTVFINNYRAWVNQSWYEYAIKLERVLKNNGFEFIHFPWALKECPVLNEREFREKYPYADDQNEGFGYFINYLQTEKHIFLPIFGIEEDQKAVETVARHVRDHEVVPVNCAELSMLGGLMNCVTWED